MIRSRSARAGLLVFVLITVALVGYSLWWFDHPAPCVDARPHCDAEFASSPSFRQFTLAVAIALGIASGFAAWAITAIASRLRDVSRRPSGDRTSRP
jgi:hypothetical protein